jgi:hypothetical protein
MPDPDPRPPRVVPLKVVERRRPDPPDDLPPREADLWRAIVAARPVNWCNNPGCELVLKLYCQAAIIGEDLSRRARGDVHFHGKLIRQSGIILRLAKQLGLLPIHRQRNPRPRVVSPSPPWSA